MRKAAQRKPSDHLVAGWELYQRVIGQGKFTEKRCGKVAQIRKDVRDPRVLCDQDRQRIVACALRRVRNRRRNHGGA